MEIHEPVDIENIIASEKILTFFQPIISIKRRSIIMFEALSRGYGEDENNIISPSEVFDAARRKGLSLECDRVCRKKALERFKECEDLFQNCLMCVNIDTSILRSGIVGSGHLINLAESLDIAPSHVVIEIVESSLDEPLLLEEFVNRYREYGFLIAIDDLGAGFSNLNRIVGIQPNIIKLDMDLVKGVSEDFYKKETVQAVIHLAHSTGALTVGEGVENIKDAVCLMHSGIDMLQGYYFARPSRAEDIREHEVGRKIEEVTNQFKTERIVGYRKKKSTIGIYNHVINSFTEILGFARIEEFDHTLQTLIHKFPEIECSYIISEDGIQISETVSRSQEPCNILFRPDPKGTDQSLKDYFFYIKAGQKFFVSNPYISAATGKMCITISTRFLDYYGSSHILCIDIID